MSSPIIRQGRVTDIPAITQIYRDVILNTTAVYAYEPYTLENRQTWYEDRVKQGFPVFVAEQDNQVIGFSTYGSFRSSPAYLYSVENTIHVHPEFRGQGIGQSLMPPIIEAARAPGMHTMVAGIDASNHSSVKFHQKFGFVQVAVFKQVGFKFNRWLDLIFMQLMLEEK